MSREERRESTAPSRFTKVAIGCLAAFLVLVVVEMTVRVLDLAPNITFINVTDDDSVYKRSTNPILGFELKANYRNPRADLVTSYPSTNSYGQRDVERSLEKPPGTRRILVLGASIVEGFGIREIDDTISRQLERLYGDGTEVLNFGVSAYCTRAKVELLRVKGLNFDPDDVVLVFTQNDFNNFNHEAFQLGSPVERPAFAQALFEGSHLFRFLATRLNWFYFGAQMDPVHWNKEAIGDNNVADGLALFAKLSQEYGFRPLVAIWPRFTNDAIVNLHPMPDNPKELVIERLAWMYGIPTFRFSDSFEEHRAALGEPVNPRRYYTLGDWIHPNVASCGIAAWALHHELERIRGEGGEGRAGTSRGQDLLAIETARTLGLKDPHKTRIMVNLGNTLLSQGKADEAIRQYEQALRLKPDLAEAHNNLGVALRSQGKVEEALSHYLEALRLDPDLADTHNNVGVILARQGREEEALVHFRRALEIRSDFPDAKRNLEALTRSKEAPR